jgi:hypothetical protein
VRIRPISPVGTTKKDFNQGLSLWIYRIQNLHVSQAAASTQIRPIRAKPALGKFWLEIFAKRFQQSVPLLRKQRNKAIIHGRAAQGAG